MPNENSCYVTVAYLLVLTKQTQDLLRQAKTLGFQQWVEFNCVD